MEQVNADLATEEGMHEVQIRRFLVLHKELDRTTTNLPEPAKCVVGLLPKIWVLIDALYDGRTEQFIETAVKFEDGRTGKVSATLKILEAKVFPPVRSTA